MNSDPTNNADRLDEQLVAYLDGELDAEGVRRIEALLASDPQVRRRLQSLERTWDLLDELDSAPPSEPFTQTTLEMVALAASSDAEQAVAKHRQHRRLLVIAGSVVAALAAGFLAVTLLVPDPNLPLLRDLPLLENLDDYRQVESIEFLHLLRDKGLFIEPISETEAASRSAPHTASHSIPSSLESRRQLIESLPPADKEQLQRTQERFARLNVEVQQRLRQLHDSLPTDVDAPRLRLIMANYGQWLKTQSSYRRAELLDLKPAERVLAVEKRLRDERRREGGRRMSDKDLEAVLAFLNDYASRHEAEYLASQSDPKQRERLTKLGPVMRHLAFFRDVWQPWLASGASTPPPMMTDADWDRLRAAVSPEVRNRLEKMTPPDRWRALAGWSRQALQHRATGRGTRSPMPRDDDQRLAEFFEKELSDEDRDRLLAMPGEEMLRRLQQMYLGRPRGPEGRGHSRPGDGAVPHGGPSFRDPSKPRPDRSSPPRESTPTRTTP